MPKPVWLFAPKIYRNDNGPNFIGIGLGHAFYDGEDRSVCGHMGRTFFSRPNEGGYDETQVCCHCARKVPIFG